jgi:DnaJ-class molecular chaperone
MNFDSFAMLGVIPSASRAEIEKVFRRNMCQTHPYDKNPSVGNSEFEQSCDAKEKLLDTS